MEKPLLCLCILFHKFRRIDSFSTFSQHCPVYFLRSAQNSSRCRTYHVPLLNKHALLYQGLCWLCGKYFFNNKQNSGLSTNFQTYNIFNNLLVKKLSFWTCLNLSLHVSWTFSSFSLLNFKSGRGVRVLVFHRRFRPGCSPTSSHRQRLNICHCAPEALKTN